MEAGDEEEPWTDVNSVTLEASTCINHCVLRYIHHSLCIHTSKLTSRHSNANDAFVGQRSPAVNRSRICTCTCGIEYEQV